MSNLDTSNIINTEERERKIVPNPETSNDITASNAFTEDFNSTPAIEDIEIKTELETSIVQSSSFESTNKADAATKGPITRSRKKKAHQDETLQNSILKLWNLANTHEFADTFRQPVTEEADYETVVHSPMSLSVIKKNIDTGGMKSIEQFQRDINLMLMNAIMYYSADTHKKAFAMFEHVKNGITNSKVQKEQNKERVDHKRKLEKGESEEIQKFSDGIKIKKSKN